MPALGISHVDGKTLVSLVHGNDLVNPHGDGDVDRFTCNRRRSPTFVIPFFGNKV
jgi:hypothetical protein